MGYTATSSGGRCIIKLVNGAGTIQQGGKLSEKRDREGLVLVSCIRGPSRVLRMPPEDLTFPSWKHHVLCTACSSRGSGLVSKVVLHCPNITEQYALLSECRYHGLSGPGMIKGVRCILAQMGDPIARHQ
jgi:hypothetical protein